jgi:hypothetical protein
MIGKAGDGVRRMHRRCGTRPRRRQPSEGLIGTRSLDVDEDLQAAHPVRSGRRVSRRKAEVRVWAKHRLNMRRESAPATPTEWNMSQGVQGHVPLRRQ